MEVIDHGSKVWLLFAWLNLFNMNLVLFVVPALPQPPDNLVVLEVTLNSVKLAWNSTNTTAAPVKSYVVQYRRNGSSDDYKEISVFKPEISVGGLAANTAYEFRLFVVNDVGQSTSSVVIVFTNTDTHTG